MDEGEFRSKDEARRHVWELLDARGAAAFPLPARGRIPNFRRAGVAAKRLMQHPWLLRARRIKCNPDAPQRPVRQRALAAGIEVIVPTPRLRGGFLLLDPRRIPPDRHREAAGLRRMERWARALPVEHLPAVDLVVVGSTAVTRSGRRCGKGHGYGDLEYAVLRELGHAPVPVATTVHPLQIVGNFPVEPHDLPVSVIVTPEETIEVDDPPPPPEGIDWSRLDEAALREMPALHGLRRGAG